MNSSEGSPFSQDGKSQQAGAHAGLSHPPGGPLDAVHPAGSSQDTGKAVAPITVHPLGKGDHELIDATGLVITKRIVGLNSAAAIAGFLNQYIADGGACLRHLAAIHEGRCFACAITAYPHPFSLEYR